MTVLEKPFQIRTYYVVTLETWYSYLRRIHKSTFACTYSVYEYSRLESAIQNIVAKKTKPRASLAEQTIFVNWPGPLKVQFKKKITPSILLNDCLVVIKEMSSCYSFNVE